MSPSPRLMDLLRRPSTFGLLGPTWVHRSHKVNRPWAADAVSLRELPICESLTALDGPAPQAIHPEFSHSLFPPTPPTPTVEFRFVGWLFVVVLGWLFVVVVRSLFLFAASQNVQKT